MNLKERALDFAIRAHINQVRKNEPDKPMIIHPLGVGMLLESYGYDDEVVAAGYLHDVVEDTKYTLDDIEKEFGSGVAALVWGASEEDKSLSWEIRKKHTIDIIKELPFRNKLVIAADKINNLEDLMIKFMKTGKRDFSAFKRGEEAQKWYYTSVYESLVDGEDINVPIFFRLKDILDIVFLEKENCFLKDVIFKDNLDYYQKLNELHASKLELQKLKSLCLSRKPFVIEFLGTPRSGKTTTINNLYDFFKKGGFDVCLVEEFTTSKYYKDVLRKEFIKFSMEDLHIAIMKEVEKQLYDAIKANHEVILIDRSINDRQIWNYRRYQKGDFREDKYIDLRDKYSDISRMNINFLVVHSASSLISLKRDYLCNLALEERSFLNLENLDEYNHAMMELEELFKNSVDNLCFIDSDNMDMNDISIEVARQVMPVMRKKYIKTINDQYYK